MTFPVGFEPEETLNRTFEMVELSNMVQLPEPIAINAVKLPVPFGQVAANASLEAEKAST